MFISLLQSNGVMIITNRSEVPRLDVFVSRVKNAKASILIALNTEFSLIDGLGILEMLLGVNDIGIKSPWIGVDVWLLLSLSWFAGEIENVLIVLSGVSITLWPELSPVGFLVLHKVILVNTTDESRMADSMMMVVASISSGDCCNNNEAKG